MFIEPLIEDTMVGLYVATLQSDDPEYLVTDSRYFHKEKANRLTFIIALAAPAGEYDEWGEGIGYIPESREGELTVIAYGPSEQNTIVMDKVFNMLYNLNPESLEREELKSLRIGGYRLDRGPYENEDEPRYSYDRARIDIAI